MTISAWKETSEAGNAYTSLKTREFTNNDGGYNQSIQNDPNSEKNVVHGDEDEIGW